MYQQTSKHQPNNRTAIYWIGLFLCLLLISCAGLPEVLTSSAPTPTAVDNAGNEVKDTPAPPLPTAEPIKDTPAPPPPTAESTAAEAAAPTTAPIDTPIPASTPAADAPPTPTDQPAQPPPPTPLPSVAVNYNTALILDASGSMLADLGGQSRLIVAQDAVGSLSAAMPASIHASLWVYGHRVEKDDQAASCRDIEQVIPLGPVDAEQFDRTAHSFPAKGYTPITDALIQAAASLPIGENERNSIILVSDGEETCSGDPCALAAQLAAGEVKVTVHTIGLAVDDVTRAQLQCIAEASDGTYTDAQSGEDLTLALEEAAQSAAGDTFAVVEGLGNPTVILVSPNGQDVYVAATVQESILHFRRDPTTGRLTFMGRVQNRENGVEGMVSPFGIAISPDGAQLYVSGDEAKTVVALNRDPDSGNISYLETVDAFGDYSGNLTGMKGIAISPDGQSVYATAWHNGGRDDAIAVFNRDADTGRLTRIQVLRNGENGVEGLSLLSDVVVSPDNRYVYLAGSKKLVVFSRDTNTGLLFLTQILDDRTRRLD